MFNATEPVFGPEGKYLFFLSDREYAPQVSSAEWDYATDRTTGIFALALRKDVPAPFPPRERRGEDRLDRCGVRRAAKAPAAGDKAAGGSRRAERRASTSTGSPSASRGSR